MTRVQFLMCRPDHYNVEYEINPWMKGNILRPDTELSKKQWNEFHQHLSQHADVSVLPQPAGVPDMVFAANGGFILNKSAIISNFRHAERQPEEDLFEKYFRENGYSTFRLPREMSFEGAGDALVDSKRDIIWAGYGFRTNFQSHALIAALVHHPIHSLRLIDPRFYHLDTCFAPLSSGHILYYPAAFDRASQQLIEQTVDEHFLIPVKSADALQLCCNCVEADGKLFLSDCSKELEAQINQSGLQVIRTHLNQFHLAGGSHRCLVLKLDDTIQQQDIDHAELSVSEIVELSGHLIDHQILSRVCSCITENGGAFRMQSVEIGALELDNSTAQIRVSAPNKKTLQDILTRVMECGGEVQIANVDVETETVELDGVAPDDFYCSCIFSTDVQVAGKLVRVRNQRMDCPVVISKKEDGSWDAVCKLIRDLEVGDEVIVGFKGIHHRVPEKQKASKEEFQFMGSGVSSERRVETAIDQIAWEMTRIHERNGRIIVVAGPVVVHTGGTDSLCQLIELGFVQGLLGGNAIAVHDMERDLFGTSLGVDMDRGVSVEGGHRHHLRTINSVRRAGSIKEAVKSGMIQNGIMKTLVDCDVPFVLAGSIRDDGPLPDTLMDLCEAQNEYQKLVRGADMVLMLSSMLHSIGTGNMVPSGVRLVSVDINPAVATKLADRGSLECIGLVTDVGLFLKLLVGKINSLLSVKSSG